MGVQASRNIDNRAFILKGDSNVREAETIAQDAGRTAVLATHTLMAKNPTTGKWVPLTDIDPDAAPAKMVTGAIGSEATFQAVSDGEFAITVDGVAMDITGLDFSGIEAPTATGASCVCGAFGSTLAAMQAITDGAFAITVDGVALAISGLDFSDIDAPSDAPATGVCGANGANLAAWQAVANGAFQITVNGVAHDITGLDFGTITALDEIVDTINAAVEGKQFRAIYDSAGDYVTFVSNKSGRKSTITALTAGSAGTDISGAGFLNGLTGTITLTQGTGGLGEGVTIADVINDVARGRFRCEYDAAAATYIFLSPRRGAISTITALSAPGAGTDISGAGYLNGLTGTATLTQGTGDTGDDRNIADVINEKAEGRFFVLFDGTYLTFISPTVGGESAITVLSAVSGGTGTDISGASYLNGLTGTGTVTAATGFDGVNIPAGIYMGAEIAAATLVAGDVSYCPIMIGGDVTVDREQVTLENSLALTDVVVPLHKRIEDVLYEIGIFCASTVEVDSYENA